MTHAQAAEKYKNARHFPLVDFQLGKPFKDAKEHAVELGLTHRGGPGEPVPRLDDEGADGVILPGSSDERIAYSYVVDVTLYWNDK